MVEQYVHLHRTFRARRLPPIANIILRTEKPFVHHTQIIIGTTIPWLRLLQTNLCPWLWSMEISYEGDSM